MKKTAQLINLFILAMLLFSCKNNRGDLEDLARRLASLDGVEMSLQDEKRTTQLILKIKMMEGDIGEVIDSQNNQAEFLKLLGLKYMDYRMWSLAAETFDQANRITPENSRIHYYRAVCLGQQAKLESSAITRRELFEAAEMDYLSALRLEPAYSSALYGLAILYVYEMDRVYEAEILLDDLIYSDPSFLKGLMLRARLYEEDGNRGKAAELYQAILDMDRDEAMMDEAESRLETMGGRR